MSDRERENFLRTFFEYTVVFSAKQVIHCILHSGEGFLSVCVHVLECLPLEFVVESGHHVVPAQLAPNQSGSEDLGVNPPSKWKTELFSHNSGQDFQITTGNCVV